MRSSRDPASDALELRLPSCCSALMRSPPNSAWRVILLFGNCLVACSPLKRLNFRVVLRRLQLTETPHRICYYLIATLGHKILSKKKCSRDMTEKLTKGLQMNNESIHSGKNSWCKSPRLKASFVFDYTARRLPSFDVATHRVWTNQEKR